MLELVENRTAPAQIKVVGVGGGGSNAVNRMVSAGLEGVDFWIANTDMQALQYAACANRLQIGTRTTRGRGAGGDPEIGRLSAEEDEERIQEAIFGADMLFITAGMGGGTGTGAAPVVARIAKELGILTVAIVTKPFQFEGRKKMKRAQEGLAFLSEHVDTLIAIPNEKLLHIIGADVDFLSALQVADEVLFQATRGISDLITGHGIINLDFADVRTVMRARGNALLGCGTGYGPDRAIEAAQAAVSSPLLEELSIEGAAALLVNVQGGPGMSFQEAALAAQFITERAGEDADVFYGAVVDAELGDEMRVTIIATGFPETRRTQIPVDTGAADALRMDRVWSEPRPTYAPESPMAREESFTVKAHDERIPERMPERMTERVPERVSEREPETRNPADDLFLKETPAWAPIARDRETRADAPADRFRLVEGGERTSYARPTRPAVGHAPARFRDDYAEGRGKDKDALDVPTFLRKRMD